MLNAIIGFSIRNKLIVGLFVLGLIVTGIIQLRQLPVDALPDITSNQVQVITSCPALAAPEVERLVTFTVEQACSNIPGLTDMRSISRFGLSVVTLVFADNLDIYLARQQVAERLNAVREEIPPGTGSPGMAPLTTGLGEVYQYIVRAQPGYENRYGLAELRSIQDWIIRRQLLGTPGVADVSSFGGYLKEYEVSFNPGRLQSLGVTVSELYGALQRNNQNGGGAYIERHGQIQFIRTEGLVGSLPDIENMVVKTRPGMPPLKVGDVATVQMGHAVRYGALVDGSRGEVSGAVVLMLKGANGQAVANAIKERMAQIEKTLPQGVVVEPFYDRSKMVNRAIDTITTNLLEGALIVVFVLVLFLGNLRAGLLVASVIPLAMLFAIIMMNLFGVSGNLMSLGALDFGLIVDGAVIIVEAVLHRLHGLPAAGGRLTQAAMDEEVGRSSKKMMNAAMFGQIIILIVYLPILALVGIEGKMFRPMAQTVSFALVGAFLLSLTYVPMMAALMLSKKVHTGGGWAQTMVQKLEGAYLPVLRLALRYKAVVLGVAIGLFALSLLGLSRLGGEFIPELEEGDFAVDTRLLTGASLTATVAANQQAAAILERRFPEVEKIVVRVGASEIPTDPMPVEMSDLIITLKPKQQWTSATSYDELANKMSAALEGVPGLSAGFQFPVQMRFNELIAGARQDVVCKIYGEDLDTLARYAALLGTLVQGVPGAEDVYIETVTGLPQIVVKYNRGAMAAFGIDVEEANQVVRTAFAGQAAGKVYENERRFDLVLRLEPASRTNLGAIENLVLTASNGQLVPLSQVATVRLEEGPNQIQRQNGRRRIIVAFNVREADVETVVKTLQQKVLQSLRLPAGYGIEYGGAFQNLEAASARLQVAVPAALLLILLLLFFAFKNLPHALLIFTAIPLSAIGGIAALYLRGMPFSISAGVGFIALFGVAVLNGIVLITEFNKLKMSGLYSLNDAVLEGSKTRLRPVLITALVASLGFLPMALSQSAGAEVQRPLASVVIGGLVSATLLTLLLLPALYSWLEGRKAKKRGGWVAGLLLALATLPAQGQNSQPLTLANALSLLPATNTDMQNASLRQQYLQALVATAGQQPKASIATELGQTNAAFFDSRVMVAQNLLPFGYARAERELLSRQVEVGQQERQLKLADLRLLVRHIYAQYGYELALQQRLLYADSLYQRLLTLAAQRLKAGETNSLEQAGFVQQKAQVQQQLLQSRQQGQVLAHQLQLLLKLPQTPALATAALAEPAPLPVPDTSLLARHPLVLQSLGQLQVAQAETELEKARRRPELELGYNNQSLIGWQTARNGTDKFYEASHRFQAAQVGLSFPLLGRASKAKVKAAQSREQWLEQQWHNQQWQLAQAWLQTYQQAQMQLQQVQAYGKQLLPNANSILATSSRQLQAGELNYVNWMLLAEPALQTWYQYLNSLRSYSVQLAYLEYFTEFN